jgi:hypothetical protein
MESNTNDMTKIEKVIKNEYINDMETYHNIDRNFSEKNAQFQKTACLTYTCWGRWSNDILVSGDEIDDTQEMNIKSGWVIGQINPNITQYLQKTGTVSYAGNIIGQSGRMTTVGTNSATGRYTGDITGTFNLQANINGGYNNQMSGTMNMTNTRSICWK